MEFLHTNIPPIKTEGKTFAQAFYSLIPEADRIDIAVGYITADSLAELKQALIFNKNIKLLNLVIGMHYWDKFTKLQYNAALALNDYLLNRQRGEVLLVQPFKFHGKLYTYSNEGKAFAGIIGSDNLGSIVDSLTRTYEVSFLFREIKYADQMRSFIENLSKKAAINIADCHISDFQEHNTLLEGHENVEKVLPEKLLEYTNKKTKIKFFIPLVKNGEVPQKSNLNCYFGKGRESRNTGLVQPRHWYEVELIVPKEITQQAGYPQKNSPEAVFDVITDDGWKFSCKVSGDFSKNFRSENDLKILGKWIKGRLENAGMLEVGELITSETFKQYGRDNFTLTQTTVPNLWHLDFGVNR